MEGYIVIDTFPNGDGYQEISDFSDVYTDLDRAKSALILRVNKYLVDEKFTSNEIVEFLQKLEEDLKSDPFKDVAPCKRKNSFYVKKINIIQ